MADVALFPFIGWFFHIGLKYAPRFPYINAYYNKVCQRESIKAVWMPYWVETGPRDFLAHV